MYFIPKVNRNIHESIDDLEKDQNQKKKIKNQHVNDCMNTILLHTTGIAEHI